MAENSTADLEPLKRMLAAIEAYSAGSITLSALTQQLDTHYWPLLHKPVDWRRQLRSRWVVLEEVHMLSLFRGQEQIDSFSRALVERTVPSLTSLIDDALRSTPGDPPAPTF